MISARSESASTSTSKRERSSSSAASAIDSRTRTLGIIRSGHRRVLVRLERRGHADAALDLCAEVDEQELHGSELRRDVEHVEPADVTEPEDLSLQTALPVRDRHPVPIAQAFDDVVGADPVRHSDGRDDGTAILVRRKELETHGLRARAAGAAQADVTVEHGLEAFLEQKPECDVEPGDERDGRRECSIELGLRLT